MGGSKTLLTLEEFQRLPDREGTARELDEGELTVMTPGRPRHNRIRDRIARRLMEFAEGHGLGEVFVETEFQLGHDTVRIPDAAFVPADRMKKVDLDRAIEGAPALAIEVVSPNDLAEDLARKVDQYLASGARSVWVLYPKTREVHIFGPGSAARTLGEQELLGDDVLFPGFSVSVGALFE
jgi:Uma2 family endonuclease